MKLQLKSTKQFKLHPSYYTLKKTYRNGNSYYNIIYGHFYNNTDMFIYEKVTKQGDHIINKIYNDYFRIPKSDLATNEDGEYYFTSTLDEIIAIKELLDRRK